MKSYFRKAVKTQVLSRCFHDILSFSPKINGSQIENIPFKEAKTLLKRSILSLTILKANASTASSHKSLANPLTEQEKESSENQSSDTDKNQSSPFFAPRQHRCPSVPLSMPSRIPEYPVSVHSRRSSVMSGSSLSSQGRISPDRMRRSTISENDSKFLREIRHLDEVLRQNSEKDSFPGRYSEGQLSDVERDEKLRNHRSPWPSSPPSQPVRTNSYMTAVISRHSHDSASNETSINSDSLSATRNSRPQSAPGSRQYVSGVNASRRHDILLQNGASPMRFGNWIDSFPQGYSLPKSVGRQSRRQRSNIAQYLQTASGTLPLSAGRSLIDSDRRLTEPFSTNSMKICPSYVGRNHYKSTSSHASSTSSMSSGFNPSHSIRPVHEEDPRYVI